MSEAPPFLISWNLTERCNLRCGHCYIDATMLEGAPDLISTEEAMDIADQIAALSPGAMLILTGGEPMLRGDIFHIAGHAAESGLNVVLGTNGTLIDSTSIEKIRSSGIKGVGLSLDSLHPHRHDAFRGMEGAWQKTMDAMALLKEGGVDFQVQCTVTKENYEEIEDVIELACREGARVVNIFFLVCTGRGQEMSDISPEQYENMLKILAEKAASYGEKVMVRARCAPHFLRIAEQLNPGGGSPAAGTSGCIAGRGYMRISPSGDLTPCPYLPLSDGNIRKTSLADIWEESTLFRSFRTPEYEGKCRDCSYRDICGGCRAKAYASTGDIMGEDPWCLYEPEKDVSPHPPAQAGPPVWTEGAKKRLENVPVFLRPMVRKGMERYASLKGCSEITEELMAEARRLGGRRQQ